MMMILAQTAGVESISYGWLFTKTIIIMVIIIILAFVCLKFLLPKLMRMRHHSVSTIEVLDFQPLEQRKSVYVIRIEDKKFAIAVSDHSIAKLGEWDFDEDSSG